MWSKEERKKLWRDGEPVPQECTDRQEFIFQCSCCENGKKALKYIPIFDGIMCRKCCLNHVTCATEGCEQPVACVHKPRTANTLCRECALGDISDYPVEIHRSVYPSDDFTYNTSDFEGKTALYEQVAAQQTPGSQTLREIIKGELVLGYENKKQRIEK